MFVTPGWFLRNIGFAVSVRVAWSGANARAFGNACRDRRSRNLTNARASYRAQGGSAQVDGTTTRLGNLRATRRRDLDRYY